MKKFFKYFLTVIVTVVPGFTMLAQEDEDIKFEPIHSTILPGSGTMRFEEVYEKKSMITTNGDALMFKCNLPLKTNIVELPINAMQDYTMEFTFNIPKFKGWIIMNFSGFTIAFTKKKAMAKPVDLDMSNKDYTEEKKSNSLSSNIFGIYKQLDKQFKMPVGVEKNQYVCKIIKRKKIITIFINNKFLTEFNIKPTSSTLEFDICFFLTEGELQSIRLDQGPENDDED